MQAHNNCTARHTDRVGFLHAVCHSTGCPVLYYNSWILNYKYKCMDIELSTVTELEYFNASKNMFLFRENT